MFILEDLERLNNRIGQLVQRVQRLYAERNSLRSRLENQENKLHFLQEQLQQAQYLCHTFENKQVMYESEIEKLRQVANTARERIDTVLIHLPGISLKE